MEPHDTPPQAPPPPPPTRRLLRYPDAGPGAGVAAGLGAYFGIDPVLFRIGFVLLVFAGGTGILVYLLAWALVPEAATGEHPPPAPARGDGRDETARWVGIGLVVIAGLWLTAQTAVLNPPVVWAIALIVAGVLLFRGDLPSWRGQPPQAPPHGDQPGGPAAGVPAAGFQSGGPGDQPGGPAAGVPAAGYQSGGPADPPAPEPAAAQASAAGPPPGTPAAAPAYRPPAPPPPPSPPPPPQPASRLGRLTVGVGLLTVGGAALLDTAGLLQVTARHYLALVLLVTGLGLLLGAWWGRARGLVAVGLVLVPLLLFAGVADAFWSIRGGVGERFYAPGSLEEVADSYELFAGQMVVDLSAVDFEGEAREVLGRVTFGELTVVVPPGVDVEVDAVVGAGEITLPGAARGGGFAGERPVSGLRVERQATIEGDGEGSLTLDLSSGFGTVNVERAD